MMKGICLFWAVIMLLGVSNAWSEGEETTIIIGILMIVTFIAIYKRIDKDENRIKELQKKMREDAWRHVVDEQEPEALRERINSAFATQSVGTGRHYEPMDDVVDEQEPEE